MPGQGKCQRVATDSHGKAQSRITATSAGIGRRRRRRCICRRFQTGVPRHRRVPRNRICDRSRDSCPPHRGGSTSNYLSRQPSEKGRRQRISLKILCALVRSSALIADLGQSRIKTTVNAVAIRFCACRTMQINSKVGANPAQRRSRL